MPLTRREAFVITAFTGISTTNFGEFQGFAEKILGRPIWTHEFGSQAVWDDLKEATRDEFLDICKSVPEEPEAWELHSIERQGERITRLEEAHPIPTGPIGGPDVSYLRATWQDPSSQ